MIPYRREIGEPNHYPFTAWGSNPDLDAEKRIISIAQQCSWAEDELSNRDNSGSPGQLEVIDRIPEHTELYTALCRSYMAYTESLLNAKLHVHSVKLNKVRSV